MPITKKAKVRIRNEEKGNSDTLLVRISISVANMKNNLEVSPELDT